MKRMFAPVLFLVAACTSVGQVNAPPPAAPASAGTVVIDPDINNPAPATITVPKVFIARNGVAELTSTLLSHDQVRDLVERILKSSGRT